jgi:hypothetical protein
LPSAPDRPWQKRYSAAGPVSAAITCLGIAVAAVPHRQRPGQAPYAQNADLNLWPDPKFYQLFVSIMSWSAFFPWFAHVPFLDLPTGISSSRLRLIEHGASDAPCLILQADTLHGPALQPGLSTGVYTRHGEPAGKSMITVRCPMYVRLILALPGSTTAFLRDGDGQTSHSPRRDTPQRFQV